MGTTIIDLFLGQEGPLLLLTWGITLLIHGAFAYGVFKDIRQLAAQGRRPVLVTTGIWCLATLIGGVVVGALYWLVHHTGDTTLKK